MRPMSDIVQHAKGWILGSLLQKKHPIDFAIIGFPKCATTSIHKTLVNSPSICIPDYEMQIKHYIKQDIYPKQNHPLFGIKNPNLIYEGHNLRALYHANPNIKIVVGLRNPTKWLYSFFHYRKLEIQNNRDWLNNRKYLKTTQNFSDINFKELVDSNLNLLGSCIGNGIYINFISELLKIFPSSNIHIYFLEEIADNPLQVYHQLYSFFDMTYDESWPRKTANRNYKKYERKEKYKETLTDLDNYYAPYNKKLNRLLKEIWGIKNNHW